MQKEEGKKEGKEQEISKIELKKACGVCGKKLEIILDKDKNYSVGHYFWKIKIPVGKGEYIKIGTFSILKKKYDVVKWTGKEKEFEYWECDKCYYEEFQIRRVRYIGKTIRKR